MTVLIAIIIAITAFNGGRIAERWITTEHDRVQQENP